MADTNDQAAMLLLELFFNFFKEAPANKGHRKRTPTAKQKSEGQGTGREDKRGPGDTGHRAVSKIIVRRESAGPSSQTGGRAALKYPAFAFESSCMHNSSTATEFRHT